MPKICDASDFMEIAMCTKDTSQLQWKLMLLTLTMHMIKRDTPYYILYSKIYQVGSTHNNK